MKFGIAGLAADDPRLPVAAKTCAATRRDASSRAALCCAMLPLLLCLTAGTVFGADQADGSASPELYKNPQKLMKTKPAIKPQTQAFEVTGEVVDAWCFASKVFGEGRGPEHYSCADACAHGGVSLGIVDDKGNLYIAAKYKAYQGCQHLLEPFVAKRVHVKGWLARAGGCQLLKIDEVKEVKSKHSGK